jgi:hypothetical protein
VTPRAKGEALRRLFDSACDLAEACGYPEGRRARAAVEELAGGELVRSAVAEGDMGGALLEVLARQRRRRRKLPAVVVVDPTNDTKTRP